MGDEGKIDMHKAAFTGTVQPPVSDRTGKPRQEGITMVIDKGLGLYATEELLSLAGDYIDFLKLGFGTALLYPDDQLEAKIQLARTHRVLIYPGGTLLEVAYMQGKAFALVERIAALGFTALEVSEGTINMADDDRTRLIHYGLELGLVVISEVGKKDPTLELDPHEAAAAIKRDLEAGSRYVIIEGRDSGHSVGVYGSDGAIRSEQVDDLVDQLDDTMRIIWEAPRPTQQQAWLKRLGPNANFGNVQPADVVALEATRQALRGDTLLQFTTQ